MKYRCNSDLAKITRLKYEKTIQQNDRKIKANIHSTVIFSDKENCLSTIGIFQQRNT
jgi:hypothetical protein